MSWGEAKGFGSGRLHTAKHTAQVLHAPQNTARHHSCPKPRPHPTHRANPYPEVTDLFCRLPLSTLFYQLEAVNLGDLLRLSVRLGAKGLSPSLGFSRAVGNAPDTANQMAVLCLPSHLFSGQSLSKACRQSKRKDNSSQGPRWRLQVPFRCRARPLPPSTGILTGCPFDRRHNKQLRSIHTEFPYLLGSTNPCPSAVHMEPFSTSVFKALI